MHNLDFLKRMGHRLANENACFDRDGVQALAILASMMDLTDRLLECLPGPTPVMVRIVSFPEGKRILAIKAVRTVMALGLRDSKDFVEGVGEMDGLLEMTRDQRDKLEAEGIKFEESA